MTTRGLILVRDLAVRCRIGVYDWEATTEQSLRVDIEVLADFGPAILSKQVGDTIDYTAIARLVTDHLRANHIGLLEVAADELCQAILERFPAIEAAVTLRKDPGDPVGAAFVGCSYRRAAARLRRNAEGTPTTCAQRPVSEAITPPTPAEAHGRRVLITGAARGLGAAVARHLSRCGWRVGVHYRSSASEASALATSLAAGRAANDGAWSAALQAEMGDRDAVASMVATAADTLGGLDAIIANVGAYLVRPLRETSPADFERIITANLSGTYALIHAALPELRRTGHGRIVGIGDASAHAGLAYPDTTPYHLTKAALPTLLRSVAVTEAAAGVTCNMVNPGIMHNTDDVPPNMADVLPIGRVAQFTDLFPTIDFLLSDSAAYITGAVIDVAGGYGLSLAR